MSFYRFELSDWRPSWKYANKKNCHWVKFSRPTPGGNAHSRLYLTQKKSKYNLLYYFPGYISILPFYCYLAGLLCSAKAVSAHL